MSNPPPLSAARGRLDGVSDPPLSPSGAGWTECLTPLSAARGRLDGVSDPPLSPSGAGWTECLTPLSPSGAAWTESLTPPPLSLRGRLDGDGVVVSECLILKPVTMSVQVTRNLSSSWFRERPEVDILAKLGDLAVSTEA